MTAIPDGLDADRGKTLRAPVILDLLGQEYPDAAIELDHRNNWELLVATMLSAQSTDVKVNEIAGPMFADLGGPVGFAEAGVQDIEARISSLGLFRQKAKNVHATAMLLLEHHGGEVPNTMEELIALPGVARKTANVVLQNGFGINVGVVVDTHIKRLSRRLRFTTHEDVKKIEKDLMRLFPQERWLDVADLLIFHGRRCCDAKKPACHDCTIAPLCPSNLEDGRRDKA